MISPLPLPVDDLSEKQLQLLARLAAGATLSTDHQRCDWRLHAAAAVGGAVVRVHFTVGRGLLRRGVLRHVSGAKADGSTIYTIADSLPAAVMSMVMAQPVVWDGPAAHLRPRRRRIPPPPPPMIRPAAIPDPVPTPDPPRLDSPSEATDQTLSSKLLIPLTPEQLQAGSRAGGVSIEVAAAVYRAMVEAVLEADSL